MSFHARSVVSPMSLAETAAYAGILRGLDSPGEWRLGRGAYGKRFISALGGSAIHGVLAFALDATLRQDPRYFRPLDTGFFRRAAHATRTDSGGETFSTWRFGSDYGAAFLSNEWYPDRVNTVSLPPDVKRKILRRRP